MALAIDGYAVLARIAASPDVFDDVREDATKAALGLVFAQLKTKTVDLERLRAVRRALDDDSFALILEGLKDADIRKLVGKFDKHHADLKTAPAGLSRRHLIALAEGSAQPAEKLVKARKARSPNPKVSRAKKSVQPKDPERLSSEAMRARRERR